MAAPIILSIDPGTNCGWALQSQSALLWGTWRLQPRRHESGGMRYLRLRRELDALADQVEPTLVAFEEVRRHAGTTAAHVYGGIVAVITSWCVERGIEYTSVPVTVIKKHATGKGNAKKDLMLSTAKDMWVQVDNDNEADALWLLDYVERSSGLVAPEPTK